MEPVREAAATIRAIEGSGVRVEPAHKSEDQYDFYRCARCRKLITLPDEKVRLKTGGAICPCGSLRYSPTNLNWYEYLYPRVIKFAYWRIKGIV